MINTTFLKKITTIFILFLVISCDKDYNTLGSDVVGAENFTTTAHQYKVKAYNQKLSAVQTNNLPLNQLGVLVNDNAVLGSTVSNFVTQLSLGTSVSYTAGSLNFTNNIVIDSVVLTVPYFNTLQSTNSDGRGIYRLDSIYNKNITTDYAPIDLKVFRNGEYLPDFDGSLPKKQYSNEDAKFNSAIASSTLNNDANTSENSLFVPDNREYTVFKVTDNAVVIPKVVESRSTPRMRLHLDKNYFETEIIDKVKSQTTAGDFVNNNAFKNYFRGLYFQTTQVNAGTGLSMSLDFSKGDVTVYYTQDKENSSPVTREMRSFVLNMSKNTANTFTNTNSSTYDTAVNNTTGYINGVDRLFLKGGQGSLAFIQIFDDAELNALKAKNILINDASLVFTVDNSYITSSYKKPQRVYLYNANNNALLADYYFDGSYNSINSKLNKYIYGGILEKNTLTNTDKYTIKITEHVKNILSESGSNSRNVRLALVVTEDINNYTIGALNPAIVAPLDTDLIKTIEFVPNGSIMNPLGTVLFGSNLLPGDANYNNRVKFEIYYTEPK